MTGETGGAGEVVTSRCSVVIRASGGPSSARGCCCFLRTIEAATSDVTRKQRRCDGTAMCRLMMLSLTECNSADSSLLEPHSEITGESSERRTCCWLRMNCKCRRLRGAKLTTFSHSQIAVFSRALCYGLVGQMVNNTTKVKITLDLAA